MLNPVLTLLVAGSLHCAGDDAFRPAELSAIVIHLTETAVLAPEEVPAAEAGPTVRDVSFYYDDFRPMAVPAAPLIVTYDWRSPIIFDLP